MEDAQEELQQVAAWFSEEGLAPGAHAEAQLCFLWRAHQHTRRQLSTVVKDLDAQRLQHLAEKAEVHRSLEQIRKFTDHKNVLAQEIQDENDRLKEQLRQLVSLQDAQISEVAKMLHQQGLTELIHNSPSEQVAYLLVERASLLETKEEPDSPTGGGHAAGPPGTEAEGPTISACKGTPRHGQNPWRRLFGLYKAAQSKHTFIPAEAKHLAAQASHAERECSRLERDLEEGSRRLAMAHNEIRHLTDELESAHLTQRTYEPELQSAQQEVKQLRQEVEKLKKYDSEQHMNTLKRYWLNLPKEIVELRKAKEMNDRLDFEIRALRSRVRSLDAEKSSLQQMKNVKKLESALQEEKLLAVQVQAREANELAKQLASLHKDLDSHEVTPGNYFQDQEWPKQREGDRHLCEDSYRQLEDSSATKVKDLQTQLCKEITQHKECPDYQEAVETLLATQTECETLKKEICETLKCLDKERSKYHEKKEKYKARLCRAMQKFDDATVWRDERIKHLERELSLCSHSLAKEKEFIRRVTVENEKLLAERRSLLQQLHEEENNKKDSDLTASMSKCRVDFLEMENKKLGNKVLHMSNQLAALEKILQNMQSPHCTQDPKTQREPQKVFTSLPVLTPSGMFPEMSKPQDILNDHSSATKHTAMTSYPHCLMGYLNLTSAQNGSAYSSPPGAASSSDSMNS